MSLSHPQHEPSLIDVQLAFEHWRAHRTSRRSTPKHLRALTVALLENHRPSAIYKTLGLNSSTLKQWAAQESELGTTAFVSLPDDLPAPVTTQSLTAEAAILISLPNGVQVSVLQGASLNQVLVVANSLEKSA